MKLLSLLDHLAAASEVSPAATPRRDLLAQLGRAAAMALPVGLGAALPAAAETKDTSFDALTQLLQLERLQAALYAQGLAATGLIPAGQAADFQRLLAHQNQHIALYVQSLQGAGALVPAQPTFDFSGRRNVASNPELFPNVLTNYDNFLALAQQLEDLGVRTYKTHAFDFTYDYRLAKAVLRMHSVEAQHSAHVRALRRARGAAVQNWPSEEDATVARPAGAQALTTAATGGEENAIQFITAGAKIPFANFLLFRDNTAIHDPALAEAFDEPISSTAAQAALDLFS